ncbi:unnamed protein product, partial [Adineta ricciae]
SSTGKRKRTKAPQSPDENNSSLTRSRKKTRSNDKLPSIKQEAEEAEELVIKKEEQENEKVSSSSSSSSSTTFTNSSLHVKTEDLNSTIHTPTPCKQELHSPSTILPDNSTKILLDHAKQSNTNLLLSSPSSAFSRTLKKSLLSSKDFDEFDSVAKTNPTVTGDIIPRDSLKDNDLSNDEGNLSDNSTNNTPEVTPDDGRAPLSCEKECYNKSQGIILVKVYDRSTSENSCARTDIVLKRGSRTRRKPSNLPPTPETSSSSTQPVNNFKQEDRNLSKLSFSLDKVPPMLHPSGPPLTSFAHPDPLLLNQNSPLFHPLPMHALAGVAKPPLGFPSPFGPLPPDNAALRHLDPLGFRLMNSANSTASQLFPSQSPFASGLARPTPGGFDPATAALLLDPRYRSMMPTFGNSSPSSAGPLPSSPSNHSSPLSAHNNGTHNHAHIHSHSHTHLHLNNTNDSTSSSSSSSSAAAAATNGMSLPPPPLLPFTNPLSGIPHGNPLLHPGGPLPPVGLEAMHNFARERELMSLMLANNSRFDPMSLALANPFQMARLDDLSRLNTRERSIREHNENEFRRLSLEMERQHFRFPFPPTPEELLRRY